MSQKKWTRSSLRHLKTKLTKKGILLSPPTISRLLKKNGYSLRVNSKEKESNANHPDRDKQFKHIERQKKKCQKLRIPIISVDTKKKELIGDFKNNGRDWSQDSDQVNVHDFPSDAIGKAIPYGVYDITQNNGHFSIGISSDTPEFAVDSIVQWWEKTGKKTYAGKNELTILADSGGSNSCRSRVFKKQIQDTLCDKHGLKVTVSHYPRGCSKWNPIEHKLFSYVSINWSGKPLRDYELMLGYIRGTTTQTGLNVEASMLSGEYKTGKRVSDEEMKELNIEKHLCCPQWNYTIKPHGSIMN